MRRLLSMVLAACALAALDLAPCALAADRPPNFVFILADDLGVGELGCYGQQIIRTPQIDRLAAGGMRFTQFYAGAPVCAPCRCTLMTGLHTGHAYIRENREKGPWTRRVEPLESKFTGQEPIPDDARTLAELLKQQGYATAAVGKWGLGHLGTSGAPTSQGFDSFYGYYCQRHAHNHFPAFLWRNDQKQPQPGNDGKSLSGETYSQDQFVSAAKAFIREHKDGPFFLYVPLTVPHLSIQVPDESLAQYAGQIQEAPYDHKGYQKHPAPRAGYAAMVTHMDQGVGEIVDLIDGLNLGENTLIVFTSDNGPTYDRLGGSDSDFFNSSAHLRGRKGSVYEGGIRSPLIARWTGRTPSGETAALAAMWDLLPTLCELAGVRAPESVDGLSLAGALLGSESPPERPYLYWEYPPNGGQQAVRSGRWKGVRTDLAAGNRSWQLYDLATDRSETTDVAAEHPDVVRRLSAYAKEAHVASPLFPLPGVDEALP
ncbi:MAG: arylsulfatase [Pirellulales bacterium]|nr:arylsulfatase [Pirellulales bacterium]